MMPNNESPHQKRATRSGSTSCSINLNDIKTLIDNSRKEIIATVKGEMDALRTAISTLQGTIAELQDNNKKLHHRCDDLTEEISLLKNSNAQQPFSISEVTAELEDRERRCRNFLVSGVPESPASSSEEEADKEDSRFCCEMVTAIGIDYDKIKTVRRIGRVSDDRPRLLLVKCDDRDLRNNVLSKAKSLRTNPKYRRIFVNPDRTPLQQRCWKQLRSELWKRRINGENVTIYRDRIVPQNSVSNFQRLF